MSVNIAYKWAKRIAVSIVGFTVLLVGVAMIVLPGPAFVVIPVGLGILSLEFAWARVWLRKAKAKGEELARSAREAMNSNSSSSNNTGNNKSP
jgi:tellurite resistance protein TerC